MPGFFSAIRNSSRLLRQFSSIIKTAPYIQFIHIRQEKQ